MTGGEAMYADMGHFGRPAIRAAWFAVALPALVLNYLGQAALVSANPGSLSDPFYGLAPSWAHIPLIAFATMATVIASQAIISGVFSLTRQGIQLGFLPRIRVHHTASHERGQIYIPTVNWLLAIATIASVLVFRSSDALAGAYGIAVSGLMAVSTFLAGLVARRWGYPMWIVIAVNGSLMLVDLVFFSANAVKLLDGGWFPLTIAAVVAFLMLTWRRGQQLVELRRGHLRMEEATFFQTLERDAVFRVHGVAVFLTAAQTGVPLSLSTHVRHSKALQSRVLLVSVVVDDRPFVPVRERAKVSQLAAGFERIVLACGFMESIDIPAWLRATRDCSVRGTLGDASFYIGHETLVVDRTVPGMWPWREAVFVWMQRNSTPTGSSFGIAASQLVEIGSEIRI